MRPIALALPLSFRGAALPAQAAPTAIGAWTPVSTVVPGSTARMVPTWDDHPGGLIMYAADGDMAAQRYDTRPTVLAWERVGP